MCTGNRNPENKSAYKEWSVPYSPLNNYLAISQQWHAHAFTFSPELSLLICLHSPRRRTAPTPPTQPAGAVSAAVRLNAFIADFRYLIFLFSCSSVNVFKTRSLS